MPVELDPDYIEARFGLLEYYLAAPGFLGGSEEKAAGQAAEIRKRDTLAGHRARARIYSKQKKPDLARNAKTSYANALKLAPTSEDVKAALKRVS